MKLTVSRLRIVLYVWYMNILLRKWRKRDLGMSECFISSMVWFIKLKPFYRKISFSLLEETQFEIIWDEKKIANWIKKVLIQALNKMVKKSREAKTLDARKKSIGFILEKKFQRFLKISSRKFKFSSDQIRSPTIRKIITPNAVRLSLVFFFQSKLIKSSIVCYSESSQKTSYTNEPPKASRTGKYDKWHSSNSSSDS